MEKVYLNHFYFVADEKTYEAIRQSNFITTTFSHFEERTTKTADGRTWTGLYLYGQKTYFEIFKESENWKINTLGIGLGMESVNATDALFESLKNNISDKQHTYWTEKKV